MCVCLFVCACVYVCLNVNSLTEIFQEEAVAKFAKLHLSMCLTAVSVLQTQ